MDKAAYARVGNDYLPWCITARQLFAASRIVQREREQIKATLRPPCTAPDEFTFWVTPMLTAFGIECLIKAIWLKKGNQLAHDGKYIGMGEKEPSHQLVKLCERAGIALDPGEAVALQEISDIATSLGRYPIAKRVENERRSISWPSVIVENLIQKLKAQLRNTHATE